MAEQRNGAAMRKALEEIDESTDLLDIAEDLAPDLHPSHSFVAVKIRRIARAALSAPPRNCDRFDDADAAISAFRREMRPGNPDIDLYHVIDWLLAEGEAEAKPGRKTAFNPEAYYERMLQDPDVKRIFKERHGYGLSGKDERDGAK